MALPQEPGFLCSNMRACRCIISFSFMALPDIPNQYTLSVSRPDWPKLLVDWQPVLPEGFTPWLLTRFGELIVREPNGKIGILRVSTFDYEVVAKDEQDFREWL